MLKFIVIIKMVAVPIFASELLVVTDKPTYLRYELVEVRASLKKGSESFSNDKLTAIAKAHFFYYGKQVVTIGNKSELILHYDKKRSIWHAKWPVPWSPPLGLYAVKIVVLNNGKEMTGAATFTIEGKKSKSLPKGFCVLTVEGRPDSYSRYSSPYDDNKKSWESLVEWAEFIGADALWCLVGQTHIWKKKERFEPWEQNAIDMMNKVSAKAKKQKIQYGGWICACYVWGTHFQDSGYSFATGYKESEGFSSTKFVSLGEEKRKNHIVQLIQAMEANPNISFIGLDYMRTSEFGGYEAVNEFVETMTVKLPLEWKKMDKDSRMKWLASRVSHGEAKNNAVYDQWAWFRARKMALFLKNIVETAKPTKPIWIFTLGWQQGKQHGQDPVMFIDAGASYNSIMLYHCTRREYESMMQDWSNYLNNGKSSYILGEMVDWEAHQRVTDPPGPEETVNRHHLAIQTFSEKVENVGLFWHDLSRLLKGIRGPYSTLEWAIAGGTSFTNLREKTGKSAFIVELEAPLEVNLKENFKVIINLKNMTSSQLKQIKIELVKQSYLDISGEGNKFIESIDAGKTETVEFGISASKLRTNAANKLMVACIVTPMLELGSKKAFKYKYITVNQYAKKSVPN